MKNVPSRTLHVEHMVNLDGSDAGPTTVVIGDSGEITSVTPRARDGIDGSTCLTLIPLLADAHAHLGLSDGIVDSPACHSIDHVDDQLGHLLRRGVGHVHSLGTDQRWLQQRLRTRVDAREPAERAYGYSAGIGFGAVGGWPPDLTFPEQRFRPLSPHRAREQVEDLARIGCRTLKIWVDDFGGKVPKVPVDVIGAIIAEARQCGIVTFAHVHFHQDAEALVDMGIGVLAHSVRDRIMTDELLDGMIRNEVALVPTLSREEAEMAFSMEDNPYLVDPFFLSSERALLPRLHGKRFSEDAEKPRRQLSFAKQNLARVYAAGIPIGLGTDSGFKMKLLGFAQHRELELMKSAGMSPSECLKSALGTNKGLFASAMSPVAMGEQASFFLIEGNPFEDICATRNIMGIWVGGKTLKGPAGFADVI